ncbi:MAG: hypothetical protein J0M30_01480 [Chitinophagales bacterium]|nr:hypothetical protein [Chitinophagales bacterium]
MADFFKQLVGLAGFGLVGIVIIMVIVLAYVVIKKPNNKFAILVMAGFCLIVVVLFTFAGVGIAKENKVLEEDKKELTDNNENLKDSIKSTSTMLDIKKLELITATDKNLSNKDLAEISNKIADKLDTLGANAHTSDSARQKFSKAALDYRAISRNLKQDSIKPEEAKVKILSNAKVVLVKPTLIPKQ